MFTGNSQKTYTCRHTVYIKYDRLMNRETSKSYKIKSYSEEECEFGVAVGDVARFGFVTALYEGHDDVTECGEGLVDAAALLWTEKICYWCIIITSQFSAILYSVYLKWKCLLNLKT